MTDSIAELELSVVLIVVGGKDCVRNSLAALVPQTNFRTAEIIVPFDRWAMDVGELASEFPEVLFNFFDDLGIAESPDISAHQHRLYDRRRAVGLNRSMGRIVAMTEDHAQPAKDWIFNLLDAHKSRYSVIGGAIQNGIETPINRALYYCDFGRYGLPFKSREVMYVSDVNIAYKRDALMSVKDVWIDAYRETAVHSALIARGQNLFLDNRPVIFQKRPPITLWDAIKQRAEWGRVFSETRFERVKLLPRFFFAVASVFLPPLLLLRVLGHMLRQKPTIRQIASTLPIAFVLLLGWSAGEMVGYLVGPPRVKKYLKTSPSNA